MGYHKVLHSGRLLPYLQTYPTGKHLQETNTLGLFVQSISDEEKSFPTMTQVHYVNKTFFFITDKEAPGKPSSLIKYF
jgi:hypothetical protein